MGYGTHGATVKKLDSVVYTRSHSAWQLAATLSFHCALVPYLRIPISDLRDLIP